MSREAFEEIVMLHKDRIHSYASLMLRDSTEAQDAAQEALLRLWRQRERVEARSAGVWLMRTVHNLCIDRIRRRKSRREIAPGESLVNRWADRAPNPEARAEAVELGRLIRRALDRLRPEDRAVLIMREVQQMPYDEIASALQLPLGTLKARLHRARERLRRRLSLAGAAR